MHLNTQGVLSTNEDSATFKQAFFPHRKRFKDLVITSRIYCEQWPCHILQFVPSQMTYRQNQGREEA